MAKTKTVKNWVVKIPVVKPPKLVKPPKPLKLPSFGAPKWKPARMPKIS